MATEKRLIDANGKFTLNAGDITGHIMCVENGYATVFDRFAKVVCKFSLLDAPTVDAVEVADMREFAEDVVYQFGYYCQNGGRLHITHGGLSTLEHAFDILGWENPHPVPAFECEIEGCHEHATCGTPTADGYKRMCGKHCLQHYTKMDGDGNG